MLITEQAQINRYYQALVNREEEYVGIFYVGVKTTSIFCIATCRARKPLLKNVNFYTTKEAAIENGFRPCKICKPTENANKVPEQVEKAIQLIKENPQEKISDSGLILQGISPIVVRRWFKKNHGITFHAYQNMYRINAAFLELKTGKKTTETAYQTGYESLSGFGYTYKKVMGNSPKNSKETNLILINRISTPLGIMVIGATDNGICLLEFEDKKKRLDKAFRALNRLLKATIITGDNEHIKQAKKEVEEYFLGTRKIFNVELQLLGTPFQNAVWDALTKIPFGQKVTYQQQAEKINKPNAVRAVGTANGANRISILLPCHRVIGSNGQLTGYGGGIERKKWLIQHEIKGMLK